MPSDELGAPHSDEQGLYMAFSLRAPGHDLDEKDDSSPDWTRHLRTRCGTCTGMRGVYLGQVDPAAI